MDGKGARQGQPEAAKHRCFNRYLNGVNLAPSNGEALSEDITTVAGLVRGDFLRTIGKSLNSLETFITPLRRVSAFAASCWRPVFSPPGF